MHTKTSNVVITSLVINTFSCLKQQLNQIKTWKEKVSSTTKSFCTDNGIFFVDCHEVQLFLLPQLNSIFKQMVQMVCLDVIKLSDEVVKDVDKLSKVILENNNNSFVCMTIRPYRNAKAYVSTKRNNNNVVRI